MAEDYIKTAEDYVNNYTKNPGLLSDVNYNDSRLTDIKNEQQQVRPMETAIGTLSSNSKKKMS